MQERADREASGERSRKASKFLTFTLDEEQYGIDILKVREIIGIMPFTPVPRTPHFVNGVINLRGKVIPVIDLRLRFGLPPVEYTERTCIIVVEISDREDPELIVMGIVVDTVSEVLSIRKEDIQDPPRLGLRLNMDYILGMAKMENEVKILLDIDGVLTAQEMDLLGQALAAEEDEEAPSAGESGQES